MYINNLLSRGRFEVVKPALVVLSCSPGQPGLLKSQSAPCSSCFDHDVFLFSSVHRAAASSEGCDGDGWRDGNL